jgi:hypothetical protein
MIEKYSLFTMMKVYRANKNYIIANLNGKTYEGYEENDLSDYGGVTPFLIVYAIMLIIWLLALVVTIKYWKKLPKLILIISILGLISGGYALVSLILVYVWIKFNT